MSVFVSIAAYRDEELPATLDSLVDNSTEPLHISIVEQCTKRERIDPARWQSPRVTITIQWMDARAAKGAGYARNLALQPYNNEDYFLQIDSHTQLIDGWDTKMIATHKLAQEIEGLDKIILSHYPAAYNYEGKTVHKLHNDKRYVERPQKQRPFVDRQGQIAARRIEKETDLPELATTVLAGYVFSTGDFTTLGYDSDVSFWGEEFMLSIRAWMNGWRIYAPHEMYMWHHYGRRGHERVWKDLTHWAELEYDSMEHQAAVYRSIRHSYLHKLLHRDHIDTIDEFLKNRDDVNQQSYTEVEFYGLFDVHRDIVNGRPTVR